MSNNKEPSRTGLWVVIVLMVFSWAVTIWLSHLLTNSQSRPGTFGFTVFFLCLLELLAYGYVGLMFVGGFKKRTVWAIYPALGVVVGLYVFLSVILMAIFSGSPKAYATSLVIGTLLFLIVLGTLLVLNRKKEAEDEGMATEQKALVSLSVAVLEVYQKFLGCKGSLDTESYRRAESQIRKLKERFQFCTPFGRGGAEVAAVEQEVRSNLTDLSQKIDEIPAAAKTSLPDVTKEVEGLTAKALQAMERREKLLVR